MASTRPIDFSNLRLYGSLPQTIINQLRVIRNQLSKRTTGPSGSKIYNRQLEHKRLFAKVDAILDKAKTGPLWLDQKQIADSVQEALLEKYAHLYTLWAYVVMANHPHVLLKPKAETTLGTIQTSQGIYCTRSESVVATNRSTLLAG